MLTLGQLKQLVADAELNGYAPSTPVYCTTLTWDDAVPAVSLVPKLTSLIRERDDNVMLEDEQSPVVLCISADR